MRRFAFFTITSSIIISSFLLFLLNFIFGEDRAGVLASVLHLGNGVIVAALLGGFTGLWLALGGPKRAARLAGTMLGIIVALGLFNYGRSYVWLIETFLLGVFGKEAGAYAGLVASMILFGAFGWTTQTSAGLIEGLIQKLRVRVQKVNPQNLEMVNNNAA